MISKGLLKNGNSLIGSHQIQRKGLKKRGIGDQIFLPRRMEQAVCEYGRLRQERKQGD